MAEAAGVTPTPGLPRLGLDPIACDGVGLCAHLAPDVVRIDSWGYPIVTEGLHGERQERQARAAVKGCPHRALFLTT